MGERKWSSKLALLWGRVGEWERGQAGEGVRGK